MGSDRARHRAARLLLCVGLAASTAWVAPSAARAEPSASDKETARALMTQGDKAYDAKDFPAALKAYQGAHTIMRVPGTGIWVAKTELALGHLVEARDAAIEVTRMPKQANEPAAFAKARIEAEEIAKTLAGRIPSLQVKVEGAPAGAKVTVKVDGEELSSAVVALPRKVNPGKHVGTASAPGLRDASAEIVLKEGETATMELQLTRLDAPGPPPVAAAPAPASPQPPPVEPAPVAPTEPKRGTSILVPVGFVIGGVGIGAGAVTGIIALSKASHVKNDGCSDGSYQCNNSVRSDYNSANTMGWISNVAFGVGAAGAALGIVGIVISSSKSSSPKTGSAALVVGPDSVRVRGSF